MKKITDKGLVILQPKLNIPFDRMARYEKEFTKGIENGLLIVPMWFDVLYIPEGVEVRLEEDNDSRNKDT